MCKGHTNTVKVFLEVMQIWNELNLCDSTMNLIYNLTEVLQLWFPIADISILILHIWLLIIHYHTYW